MLDYTPMSRQKWKKTTSCYRIETKTGGHFWGRKDIKIEGVMEKIRARKARVETNREIAGGLNSVNIG